MIIVTSPPKSIQLRDYVRERILSGDLAAGSRLETVRSLADKFQVSRQVVESSFDLLEEEHLIVRKGRSGVYVAHERYGNDVKGAFIMAYGVDPRHNFLGNILKITEPRQLREDFTFSTRVIPKAIARPKLLDAELAGIAQMRGIDCIVVASPVKERSIVEKFLKVPIPTLFIGDFAREFPNDDCNQITGDNALFAADCIEILKKRGHRRMAVLTGDQSLLFYADFKNAALAAGAAAHAEICSGEPLETYERALGGLLKQTRFDAILNFGCDNTLLAEAMQTLGIDPADVAVYSSGPLDDSPGKLITYDCEPLFAAIYRRIEELKAGTAPTPIKDKIHLPAHLIEGRKKSDIPSAHHGPLTEIRPL